MLVARAGRISKYEKEVLGYHVDVWLCSRLGFELIDMVKISELLNGTGYVHEAEGVAKLRFENDTWRNYAHLNACSRGLTCQRMENSMLVVKKN